MLNVISGSASSVFMILLFWMSTVLWIRLLMLRSTKRKLQFLCIVHWWQTVRLYLIFAVSFLTLHLRFCCNNTGKHNLRKPVYFFLLPSDMTSTRANKCLPVLIEMSKIFMDEQSFYFFLPPALIRPAFMNELHDMSCISKFKRFILTKEGMLCYLHYFL